MRVKGERWDFKKKKPLKSVIMAELERTLPNSESLVPKGFSSHCFRKTGVRCVVLGGDGSPCLPAAEATPGLASQTEMPHVRTRPRKGSSANKRSPPRGQKTHRVRSFDISKTRLDRHGGESREKVVAEAFRRKGGKKKPQWHGAPRRQSREEQELWKVTLCTKWASTEVSVEMVLQEGGKSLTPLSQRAGTPKAVNCCKYGNCHYAGGQGNM